MANTNKIGLEAIFEDSDFQQGVSSYNASVDDATKNTENAGSTMGDIWTGLSSVGQLAWTGLAAGVATFTAELGLAALAAMDTDEVLTKMNFVVAQTYDRTGVTTDRVLELADSLSQVVPIDDEVITSAITMGLTFDGVNKDNIQPLISAAADLSAFTGKDLPGSMKELALAISDPDKAMRLLKDANITLTDQEKKTLKGLGDVGDTAGITTFLLDELKNKGIIGLGEAMGETAKGKLTIMQTALGNLQETLGSGFLDAFTEVFMRLTDFANDPAVIAWVDELGDKIGDFATNILSKLPSVIDMLGGVVDWFKNNKPIIIGVLTAIGVAMAAFAATSAAAAISTAISFAPIILAIAAIAAVVAVFVKAWEEDWGGIQGKVADAWAQVKPVFDQLQAWLKVNLPKAIKALSEFWTKTLLPAIKKVVGWLVDNLLPVLVKIVQWLGENVPKAIKATSDFFNNQLIPALKTAGDWIENTLIPTLKDMRDWFQTHVVNGIKTLITVISGALTSALNAVSAIWRNVLLPAIQAVHNFIQNFIMPIFNAVANLMNAVVGLAVRVLAGIWQSVLLPALQSVYNFIQNLITAFNNVRNVMAGALTSAITTLSNIWKTVFVPAIQAAWDKLKPFADFLSNTLKKAFDGIVTAVQNVVKWINDLATKLNSLSLPDWLTPGSPTPLELGLVGIGKQLDKLSSASLPAVTQQLNVMASVRDVPGTTGRGAGTTINNSNQSSRTTIIGANFNIPGPTGFIEALQGL